MRFAMLALMFRIQAHFKDNCMQNIEYLGLRMLLLKTSG